MKSRIPRWTVTHAWVLVQAWVLILVTDLGLWLGARSRLERMASPRGERGGQEAVARGRRLARLVDLAGRLHLRRVRCLTRALVLQYLLKRRGLSAQLRFGVRVEGGGVESGRLRAHAWLELGGEPLGESAGVKQRFKPLVSLSASGEQEGEVPAR